MIAPLEARRVSAGYASVEVLHDVSLAIPPGPAGVALVGESGSGKSTMGRVLLGLHEPSAGQVLLNGVDVTELTGGQARAARRRAAQADGGATGERAESAARGAAGGGAPGRYQA